MRVTSPRVCNVLSVPCLCQSRHYVAKKVRECRTSPTGLARVPPNSYDVSRAGDTFQKVWNRQLILWRVGGVGSAFFPVGHYLNDIHSLLSLDSMQQAATGCYFKISKHHQKILACIIVWGEELVEKCSLGRINPREKSSRKRRSVGFLPQLPEKLCHE